MYKIISTRQLKERVLKLKVGQGFDFSDVSYSYSKGDITEYLEDHCRVEVISFYDSVLLMIGGYGSYTYSTNVQTDGNYLESISNDSAENMVELIDTFLEYHPIENIVVEEVETC